MWLFLRYSSSRSPAFLKRDALERVYAQFETGGKKGVEDPALALDAANHSRQPESMDFFLGTSRDAHDQVESGVSERRNESAFGARSEQKTCQHYAVEERPHGQILGGWPNQQGAIAWQHVFTILSIFFFR
jgi:hypothetical protein